MPKFPLRILIEHQVVEMDESMIQRCVICGQVISDYNGCMQPAGSPPIKGFPVGRVYVTKDGLNPTIYKTELDPFDPVEPCK